MIVDRKKSTVKILLAVTAAFFTLGLAAPFGPAFAVDQKAVEELRAKVIRAQMKKEEAARRESSGSRSAEKSRKQAAPAVHAAPEAAAAKAQPAISQPPSAPVAPQLPAAATPAVSVAQSEAAMPAPELTKAPAGLSPKTFENVLMNSEGAVSPTAEVVLPEFVTAAEKSLGEGSKNPMTLVESIRMALENNRTLKAAEKGIDIADVMVKKAHTGYQPQVNVQGVLTRTDHASVLSLGPISVVMADKVIQSQKVNYSQALYTFKRVEYGQMMAQKYKDAAIFSVDSARVNIIFNVKKSFYDLLLAREFVKVARESLDLIRAHVVTVTNRFNAGTASKFDLLRVEVQEANTRPALIKAANGLSIAMDAFNNILARPLFYEIELVGSLQKPDMKTIPLDNAIEMALNTRQEIKASEADLKASDYALKLAKVNGMPTVALSGTYSKDKGKSLPINKYDETWNVSVVAQMPIYDAKQTKLGIVQAQETYNQKKINFDQLIDNVKLEVKIAFQELIQASELITASEKNVEQASEALSIAKVSYDNGLNTNLEVMDAQLALSSAKTNYYQALHDYLVAFAKLEKSMGIGRIAE